MIWCTYIIMCCDEGWIPSLVQEGLLDNIWQPDGFLRLGMVVEQNDKSIKIHLDIYVKDVVVEYSEYIQKSLRPKKVPVSQGAAFKAEDAPELPSCVPCMKLVDLHSGHADADWGNSSSCRLTAGMIMLYTKSPIMWKLKMQKTTARSTAWVEVKYYTSSAASCKVQYLRALVDRLGFGQKEPTQIQGQHDVY